MTTRTPSAATPRRYAAFCRAMLDRGVYLPPSQFEAWFPSLAHTDAHVERTLEAAREAFAAVSVLARDRAPPPARRCRPTPCRSPGPSASTGALGERRFVLEAVYEGYLLHYGDARGCSTGWTPDLRLLAGDALYALGLARLAESGDVPAVAELSDLISLSAQAHAEGRGETAEALWDASAGALGPGAR